MDHDALKKIALFHEKAVGIISRTISDLFQCGPHAADRVARSILARLAEAKPPILLESDDDE